MDEYKDKNKIDVFFFLDTSGSCIGLKNRFFSAAKSLDKNKFNIRLFCFDTKVVETTLESNKVYGGSGTYFSILPKYINEVTKNKKYPEAIFVISDGYGDNLNLEEKFKKRWYWFLTTSYTKCIEGCNIYKLSDFE